MFHGTETSVGERGGRDWLMCSIGGIGCIEYGFYLFICPVKILFLADLSKV
jgi:hypothetical protein